MADLSTSVLFAKMFGVFRCQNMCCILYRNVEIKCLWIMRNAANGTNFGSTAERKFHLASKRLGGRSVLAVLYVVILAPAGYLSCAEFLEQIVM